MEHQQITVVGAGIVGLWQALLLARDGHRVRLLEASSAPFTDAASRYAGAMLAPYCEAEAAPPVVRDLGIEAAAIWRETYPGIVSKGTMVVAAARDRSELSRFARMTQAHESLDADAVAGLEPALAGRFTSALYFPTEGHMDPLAAMTHLLEACREAGVEVVLGCRWSQTSHNLTIDCRGLAAREELPRLRGVRGERVIVKMAPGEIALSRTVRLLHPRHPLYVVPWSDGRYMVGATVLESDDETPMTVRSALELLGLVYALHPGFGEAEIVDLGAGVRPAFPDNIPAIVVRGTTIHVNGMYRHGFLTGPALARAVTDYVREGVVREEIMRVES